MCLVSTHLPPLPWLSFATLFLPASHKLHYSSLLFFSLALETEHDERTDGRVVSRTVSCFLSLPFPLPLSLARLLSTLSRSNTHVRAAETWLWLSRAQTRPPCKGPVHPESSELLKIKIPNQIRGRRKSKILLACLACVPATQWRLKCCSERMLTVASCDIPLSPVSDATPRLRLPCRCGIGARGMHKVD